MLLGTPLPWKLEASPELGQRAKISIKVVPGSSKNEITGWLGEVLKVRVTAMPEKGKANAAVISLLSGRLRVAESKISISSGHTSARKTVVIDGLSSAQVRKVLWKSN